MISNRSCIDAIVLRPLGASILSKVVFVEGFRFRWFWH